jgi:hypothetical protein
VVGEQLQRHDVQDRRQFAVVLGQAQDVDAIGFGDFRVGVGEDVELAAAGLDFLEVGLELVEQLVVGGDGEMTGMSASTRASGPCFSSPAG